MKPPVTASNYVFSYCGCSSFISFQLHDSGTVDEWGYYDGSGSLVNGIPVTITYTIYNQMNMEYDAVNEVYNGVSGYIEIPFSDYGAGYLLDVTANIGGEMYNLSFEIYGS